MSAPTDALTSWHGPWRGHRALVVGLDAICFSVLDTLTELGVEVTAVAERADSDLIGIVDVLGQRSVIEPEPGARSRAAEQARADFVVVGPDTPPDDPAVMAARGLGWPVWSDVDFAWRVRDKIAPVAPWVLVGGERNAGTTIDLAARILLADHRVVGVADQATPVLDLIRDPVGYEVLLVQAPPSASTWWARYDQAQREPLVSVCSEGEGAAELSVIYEGTQLACVYWRDGGPTEGWVEAAEVVDGARAIGLTAGSPGMSELGLVEGIVVDRAFLEDRKNQALEISTLDELAEAGWELPDDFPAVIAAIAIARALEVSPELIAGVVSLP